MSSSSRSGMKDIGPSNSGPPASSTITMSAISGGPTSGSGVRAAYGWRCVLIFVSSTAGRGAEWSTTVLPVLGFWACDHSEALLIVPVAVAVELSVSPRARFLVLPSRRARPRSRAAGSPRTPAGECFAGAREGCSGSVSTPSVPHVSPVHPLVIGFSVISRSGGGS